MNRVHKRARGNKGIARGVHTKERELAPTWEARSSTHRAWRSDCTKSAHVCELETSNVNQRASRHSSRDVLYLFLQLSLAESKRKASLPS